MIYFWVRIYQLQKVHPFKLHSRQKQRNLEYLFVSGGVPFTKMSLFQPNPYKNVRNQPKIVIYFDGRKALTFL